VSPLASGLHEAAGKTEFARIDHVARCTGMSICRVRFLSECRNDPDLRKPPWTLTPVNHPPRSGQIIDRSRTWGSPDCLSLTGLCVVESCRRVQGPLAGQLLSMLGATVIRIEPPGGDPLRGMPPMAGTCSARFVALNRGKDIREIDIKSISGRAALRELVERADVFMHNWAPGKAAALGLDSADLTSVNPRLVYAYLSGWGDALGSNPPLGTDFMAQAYSGVADVACAGRPGASLMTLLDLLGGLLATEAVLAGLIATHRGGQGQIVGTSLLSASAVLLDDELRAPRRIRGRGADPLDATFSTPDGVLAMSAFTATSVRRLYEALGVDPFDMTAGTLLDQVRRVLATRPAAHWAALLGHAGVPCAVARADLAELAAEEQIATVLSREPGCAVVTSPWSFQ